MRSTQLMRALQLLAPRLLPSFDVASPHHNGDDVEAISVADPFRPRLLDEDLADIKPDGPEDVSFQVEVILMPFGVAGPVPHVVDSLGPTRADSASIEDVLRFCDAPPSLEFRVPLASERP